MVVHFHQQGNVAVVTIDNPPVNALSQAVRHELSRLAAQIETEASVSAVVLTGAGRAFVGGADITEFDRPVEAPALPDVITLIETSAKPWIAAIQGVALGGGLELALACHWRLAGPEASFALPEVNLGIIPGSGGTQRLPRLIGIEAAVAVVAENRSLTADEAAGLGLIDQPATDTLLDTAIAFARTAATLPMPPRLGLRPLQQPSPDFWEKAQARIAAKSRGMSAPLLALQALRYGAENGFDAGLAAERARFLELRITEEAAALRHLFFAERAAPRPADLKDIVPLPIRTVGVIGGGTMGVGIAAALRNAGVAVVLVERDAENLARGMAALAAIFDTAARKGTLSPDEAASRMSGVAPSVGYAGLAPCDLVIEAVFEDLAVKRAVFAEVSALCRADTILATNTSYLNPLEIAEGLAEPGRFIGLHFFSPAQIMKLLEIVPLPTTRPDVLAACFALARAMGKIPVRSGICDGFIGNRILRRYRGEAEAMVRAGVSHARIDAAMRGFGFAMGPFEMQDLAGLDISFLLRQAARARGEDVPQTPGDLLVQAGRKGQKTGGGWYDYRPGDRRPHVSEEVQHLLAAMMGPPVDLPDDQITTRLIAAMAAEGQAILAEGIARSASDIDLVKVHGYGFPRRKGGPMFLSARQS